MWGLQSCQRLYVGLGLAALMLLTRSHVVSGLPDASWAIFFSLGWYAYSARVWLVFVVWATFIDWLVITWGGVSSFCVTSTYSWLVMGYALLSLGGRSYSHLPHPSRVVIFLRLLGAVSLSAVAAELVNSGSFYFLGGRFTTPNLSEFILREWHYFPPVVLEMLLYVGLIAVLLRSIEQNEAFATHPQPRQGAQT